MLSIEKNDLRFEWSGGAYIEIFSIGKTQPFDVINVWDYEWDVARIDIAGFAKEVEGWLDENLPDER